MPTTDAALGSLRWLPVRDNALVIVLLRITHSIPAIGTCITLLVDPVIQSH